MKAQPENKTGWTTCVGRQNQIDGKPCAICGNMTHNKTASGNAPKVNKRQITKTEIMRIQDLRQFVVRQVRGSILNAVEKAYLSDILRSVAGTLDKLETLNFITITD